MAQIGAYADYADQGLLYPADELLSINTQADFANQFVTAGQVKDVQYWVAASRRPIAIRRPAARVPAPESEVEAIDRDLEALAGEAGRLRGDADDWRGFSLRRQSLSAVTLPRRP